MAAVNEDLYNFNTGILPKSACIVIVHTEWKWVDDTYSFIISKPLTDIKSIEIDPSQRMADVNRVNNKIVVP